MLQQSVPTAHGLPAGLQPQVWLVELQALPQHCVATVHATPSDWQVPAG